MLWFWAYSLEFYLFSFCSDGNPIKSESTGIQRSAGMWGGAVRKRGYQAVGKSQGKRSGAGRVSWAPQLVFGAQWVAICPGAGEARPGDKLPWQHVTAICCWSMYTRELARLRMALDGMVWPAPIWDNLICCGLICMTENATHLIHMLQICINTDLTAAVIVALDWKILTLAFVCKSGPDYITETGWSMGITVSWCSFLLLDNLFTNYSR